MKTYIYFKWASSGAHEKEVVFICKATSIVEADILAKEAGINCSKYHTEWS
jgi:hypothetical protein